jgi:hypothetical protein
MRTALLLVAAMCVIALMAGCDGDDTIIRESDETFRAVVRGGQIPDLIVEQATGPQTVETTAEAIAWVTIHESGQAVDLRIESTGLDQVIKGHIHAAPVGTNGPHLISFFEGNNGGWTNPFIRTMTAADFEAHPEAGYDTFADALDAIRTGNAYVNIHTTPFPQGEIRGQIGPAQMRAQLRGENVVPPVTTDAMGIATARFNNMQTGLTLAITHHHLMNVIAGHIHVGQPGANGPHLVNFFPMGPHTEMYIAQHHGNGGEFISPHIVPLGPENFEAHPEAGTETFDDAVNAILSQNAYVNLHTEGEHAANGEIRGQLLP